MKSIILALFLLVAGSSMSFAQCDKKISLSSSKTQHLDGSGTVQSTDDEQTVIDISKSDITVVADNGNQTMKGPIKTISCNWTTPYKEGKMVITTTLSNDNGDQKSFTVTIEGKNGKLTLLAVNKDEPDKIIRLELDKFEEKN